MREDGLRAKGARKYRITTDSWRSKRIPALNVLDRKFNPSAPNQVWCGDITYIFTAEGWMYLAVFIDLFSRKVVGWAIDKSLKKELVLKAFREAVLIRNPGPGLIVHADRGSQYTSDEFVSAVEGQEFVLSMSRSGNCWDNAVVESFFRNFKVEAIYGESIRTRWELIRIVSDFIDRYYNTIRMHSTLDYVSPLEYERKYKSERFGEDLGPRE
jgi:putative transposase